MAAENPCLPYGGHEWSPTIHFGPNKVRNTCIYCGVRRMKYWSSSLTSPVYDWPDHSVSSSEEHPNGWHPVRCPFTNEIGIQCTQPWGHVPQIFSTAYCVFTTGETDKIVSRPVEPMNSAGRFKPAFSRLRRG